MGDNMDCVMLDIMYFYKYKNYIEEEKQKWLSTTYVEEQEKYQELFKQYQEYLNMLSELLTYISLDNPISKYIALSYLYELSIFNGANNITKEISSNLGIYTLSGKGCCRNINYLAKDVLTLLGIFCEIFPCTLTREINNDGIINISNHIATIITYNSFKYVTDVYNHSFYNFFSSTSAKEVISSNKPYFVHYKSIPLLIYENYTIDKINKNLELFRSSIDSPITCDELDTIDMETFEKIKENIHLVGNFELKSKKILKRMKTN